VNHHAEGPVGSGGESTFTHLTRRSAGGSSQRAAISAVTVRASARDPDTRNPSVTRRAMTRARLTVRQAPVKISRISGGPPCPLAEASRELAAEMTRVTANAIALRRWIAHSALAESSVGRLRR